MSANVAATMGDAALVPPSTIQPPSPNESYTARPVFGSATAETSATVRWPQPVSVCQLGLGMNGAAAAARVVPGALDPAARAARSTDTRLVPPTPTTYCDDAGKLTP